MQFPSFTRRPRRAGAVFWRWKRHRHLPFQRTDRLVKELAFTAELNDKLIDIHDLPFRESLV
jgi:hypothetical protein